VLDGLAKLFAGRRKERRHSPRQQVRFTLSVLKGGERIPGIGLEISLNGCLIATQEPPAAARDDYDVLVGFLKGTASRSSSGAGRMNGEAGSA
jgi:hypothetical protein